MAKQPTSEFLLELAMALSEAEHQNVAQHMMAGALWAMYPEWFDESLRPKQVATVRRGKLTARTELK